MHTLVLRLAAAAAITFATFSAPREKPQAAAEPAGPACLEGCQWGWEVCAGLAVWLFWSEPGPVGEKLYQLQIEACVESWMRCIQEC